MAVSSFASSLLESVFNHVVLPPRLPVGQENAIDQVERALTDNLLEASRTIRDLSTGDGYNLWDHIRRMLQNCQTVNAEGRLSKTSLLVAFRDLEQKDLLILHIKEQNAGLLIRKHRDTQGESVIFEVFEASPKSESVLAAQDALIWDFPGSAVAISLSEFEHPSFQNELTLFLEQASTECIKQFAARTAKAASYAFESRDTVDPCLISEMLMTLLEVSGRRISPHLLRKRVRDNIHWSEGAERPWRRCPLWLVLRVGLQRHFYTLLGDEKGRAYYKFLICLGHARLLENTLGILSLESTNLLKKKLCRRLAKLEVDKERASSSVRPVYDILFSDLRSTFHKIVQHATKHIELEWENFKRGIQKPIHPLPYKADARDLVLTLPNSSAYLNRVLLQPLIGYRQPSAHYRLPGRYDASQSAIESQVSFALKYFNLATTEASIARNASDWSLPEQIRQGTCVELSRLIDQYLTDVGDAYDMNVEQKATMILTVMELWICMDSCATALFTILQDYNPGIPLEILDVLHLPQLQDMCRLKKVQEYLQKRHEACKGSQMTIFDDPTKGCFAERYFDDCERLQQLYVCIQSAAEVTKRRKEREWNELSSGYKNLIKQVTESNCTYTMDISQPHLRVHNDKRCTKCFLHRKARRMRIQVHEEPLSHNIVLAKAVVFELECPEDFAAYRGATWKIIGSMANAKPAEGHQPRVFLSEYTPLQSYINSNINNFSLTSTTKSFLSTHYSHLPFPVGIDEICVPNGLKLGYFDKVTKLWPARQISKPSFAHHFNPLISESSPFARFLSSKFASNSEGPTSYEIVASQTKCPKNLNVHEFMSYQSLLHGTRSRWLKILIELGSSNLNWSTEATNVLISHLTMHVGPMYENDELRVIHRIFRDESFCQRLLEQLDQRLEGIRPNWRETTCMDTLITMILKVCSMTSHTTVSADGVRVLEKAQEILLKWIGQLREEIYHTSNPAVSRTCSKYAFWASLLCRRTFAYIAESKQNILSSEALYCFIFSSITLQDNFVAGPTTLSAHERNALIRDLKMVFQMRYCILESIKEFPTILLSAINDIWHESEEVHQRSFSTFEFLPEPNNWWCEGNVTCDQQSSQMKIHFHILEGHFLLNGQPLGKLPTEHMKTMAIERLFGDQIILIYPSGQPGMTYMLGMPILGRKIHVGFRDSKLVVRAYQQDDIQEFIPCEVFGQPSNCDLPLSLIQNCCHWLSIKTGVLEVRKKPDIWKFKSSNWALDFHSRRATRRSSVLVDPHSQLFQRVARIFDRFEYREHLTVFQPLKRLSVELRRLELSWYVNNKGLLESRELRSEIHPSQDAGTWYGLNSKLVLRDTRNPQQRSIIVPFSNMSYHRNGCHVAIDVENNGIYGRYIINEVLGRLDCAAEPKLLYLKAQLHAYTSFILPDPLTKRTGIEEALHCLKSGLCQPWTSLSRVQYESLLSIAKLTPRREYYPEGLRVMQTVFWDAELTTEIQNDEFFSLVQAISIKSARLARFATQDHEPPSIGDIGATHLLDRSSLQRHKYCRSDSQSSANEVISDIPYNSRDIFSPCQRRKNVFEAVGTLKRWPLNMPLPTDLAGILQNWSNFKGYNYIFDKMLLSDLLAVTSTMAAEWGSIVKLCRTVEYKDKYRLMFLFGVLSFGDGINMDIIRTLIAFAILPDLKAVNLPEHEVYTHFRFKEFPQSDYLVQLMESATVPYDGDSKDALAFSLAPKHRRKLEALEKAHKKKVASECDALAQSLLRGWPCETPAIEDVDDLVLVKVKEALEIILPEWQRLCRNFQFSIHIQAVQQILDSHDAKDELNLLEIEVEKQKFFKTRQRCGDVLRLSQDLLRKTAQVFIPKRHNTLESLGENLQHEVLHSLPNGSTSRNTHKKCRPKLSASPSSTPEMQELQRIIKSISNSQSLVRRQYGSDLLQSLNAMRMVNNVVGNVEEMGLATLANDISSARQATQQQFDLFCKVFEGQDLRSQWLVPGGLWPCITPVTLLEQLRSQSMVVFGKYVKDNLISYALSITTLQRLLRIEDAIKKDKEQALQEEQKNLGHTNWNPSQFPDWLLLEIDANILIRPDQVDVANATISPESKTNSVLQMNMGQGKTSCIMPMAAAILADKKQLLRIVVPKALLLQTAQLLQARLGGLIGREVSHVPFSRRTSTEKITINEYYSLHNNILSSAGIMLCLPECNLSFLLSGLQRMVDGRIAEGSLMVKVQTWLNNQSRDILDECDFTLAVRTQLIYPSGSQTLVDGHPHRWETSQALLKLIESHLYTLHSRFPQSIDVVRRNGSGYPTIFFLRKDVEDALIAQLVEDICSGQTGILPTKDCTKAELNAIRNFITEPKVEQSTNDRIRSIFPEKVALRQTLYLLRGLLVHRILLLTLKKKFRVQYGLHPHRDPLAVPYHAKGVPSDQAEWGHPDVQILFTCLAFYYEGLSIAQLRQCLEHILKSDDPSSQYSRWTHSSQTLPDSLREWAAINVDDGSQLLDIWKHLYINGTVVDYYLNNFVFPKHARQFKYKLQASGWDVPLFSKANNSSVGKEKLQLRGLTTGFSGTNDNKTMLPLNIKQNDLTGLAHTNAEVLTYLLQPRNRQYVIAADHNGRHLSELNLLRKLNEANIRVLIDAGAQILEMDNKSLVKAWLKVCNEAPAAVFFDVDNKPNVIYRNDLQVPLSASPFSENLGECLVYLDEAHTRGTDLKMLPYARGALTLGLGQTKDHTVQAAMRLRQLATTQSIVFFAPPEVHQSILDIQGKRFGDCVDSYDVICWLLEQTCDGIEQLQPLYFSQGTGFCRRMQAAIDNPDFLIDSNQREAYVNALRQIEKQTIEQLYEPRTKLKSAKVSMMSAPALANFSRELNIMRKGFQDTGKAVHSSALQEVEQEREVAYEVEAVREVQKPIHYTPFKFSRLSKDIETFIKTGRLPAGSPAYEQVFVSLRRTAVGLKNRINNEATASKFYVSLEFTKSVQLPHSRPQDYFQRQVNWMLWSAVREIALIVNPEEAEVILSIINDIKTPPTHLLTYAAPVTRKMLHFNDLKYFAIPTLPKDWKAPSWLITELGIFAGRLYFEYWEYKELCGFLGQEQSSLDATDAPVQDLLRIPSKNAKENSADENNIRTNVQQRQCFTEKPLIFIQEWLTVRRKGQDFTHTPMGQVCQGKTLAANHLFFTTANDRMVLRPGSTDMRGTQRQDERLFSESLDEGVAFDESGSVDRYSEEDEKDDDSEKISKAL